MTKVVLLTCSVCGAEFKRPPSTIKSKHEGVYCSRSCHYKGRGLGLTKRLVNESYTITPEGREAQRKAAKRGAATRRRKGNYGHSKATCEKLSAKTTEAVASGKFNRVSKVEHVVAKEMAALGIDFVHQYGIRNPDTGRYAACLDFYLPKSNTAVEVNGTFWHADPRFYDGSKLFPAQKRTASRYARKVALLKRRGIRLVEIWEHDIKQDSQQAVESALGLAA
jgi:G:T-mismatch repair DNA endonuclease (very short patch repair protein)